MLKLTAISNLFIFTSFSEDMAYLQLNSTWLKKTQNNIQVKFENNQSILFIKNIY